MTYDRRAIFHNAHTYRTRFGYSIGYALRRAWAAERGNARRRAEAAERAAYWAAEQAAAAAARAAMPADAAERYAYLTDTLNFPINARGNAAFDAAQSEAARLLAQYRRA